MDKKLWNIWWGTVSCSSYRVLFAAAAVLGCQLGLDAVWNLCDSFNGLMAIPNVAALFLLSGEVMRENSGVFPKHVGEEKKVVRYRWV